MRYFKYAVSSVMVLSLVFMFIGCAQPPEAEKLAAKAAMDAAVAAGAEKYAAADFDGAKNLWVATEAQMNNKKYEEAKKGYVSVKAAFEKAAAAAAAGKTAMAAEVTAAVASLGDGWKALEAVVKSVEKKMKDKKDEWAADATAFEEGLKATSTMIATDPAGAKAKAAQLKAVLDKWDASIKELDTADAPKGKK